MSEDVKPEDRQLDNLCHVVSAEYVESLVDSKVLPPTTPEEMALGLITGEDVEDRKELRVEGGHEEQGLKIIMKFPRTQKTYERFLSERWIRGHLEERFGQGFQKLNQKQIEAFGEALKRRREPIHIGMFDADVELEGISFDATQDPHRPQPLTPSSRPRLTRPLGGGP